MAQLKSLSLEHNKGFVLLGTMEPARNSRRVMLNAVSVDFIKYYCAVACQGVLTAAVGLCPF